MVEPIPSSVRKAWDTWNIRVVVLSSLMLQTVLILVAPFRKRTGQKLVILLIWSSYLLADWAADFAVGLISNGQGNKGGSRSSKLAKSLSNDDNSDLLAFWAPFLLLHLGGPDTITAFALEDNELWLRHFLGLVFQLVATVYVYIQTLPINKLWIPTMLMFLAGVIKYFERTRALYRASLDSFRQSMLQAPDPGPNYAKLMEEYSSMKEARLPTKIEMTPEPDKESKDANKPAKEGELTEFEVVQHAYRYYKTFKGLVVDLILSFRERKESREFFLNRSAEDALKVIEVELNFIYDVLFTKVVVVHHRRGYLSRFVSFSSVVVALGLFWSLEKHEHEHNFDKFDIVVTYTLLFGAITLDAIALFMLIFSDWTVVGLEKSKENSVRRYVMEKFLEFKKSKWSKLKRKPSEGPETSHEGPEALATPRLFRRWSEKVPAFNLITFCLKKGPQKSLPDVEHPRVCFPAFSKATPNLYLSCRKVCHFFSVQNAIRSLGIEDLLDEWFHVSRERLTWKLWSFIFEELKQKSSVAEDSETAKRICAARGAYVLREAELESDSPNIYSNLLEYIENVEYDESLLLWHVATELCYQHDSHENQGVSKDGEKSGESDDYRDVGKLLSDYMLYLLKMETKMMSAVAGIGQIRFRDTCAEAERFFVRKDLGPKQTEEACEKILGLNTDVKPVDVKGDRSKSVLFEACRLAKELQKLGGEKWKIMSKVWVEMLSYGASHCRPDTHAQQISKGGQLITLVWLLMAHFGLGEQFQIREGHARAKLMVGK